MLLTSIELSDQKNSIIAVTGLGGHALLTWQQYEDENWLRDRLPADLANCKVWTYGYNSKLLDSTNESGTYELAKSLKEDFETAFRYNQVSVPTVCVPRNGQLTAGLEDDSSHSDWTQPRMSASKTCNDTPDDPITWLIAVLGYGACARAKSRTISLL